MEEKQNLEDLKARIALLEQEKNQLLKMVSHDVKSPFNKLFALSNLLQLVSDNLTEEQLDYLTRMEWVIKEGLTVVRNLIDLRAIDNNLIELSIETIKLDLIMEESLRNYAKQITTKNLIIKPKIDKVTVQSDKRLLERVIDHLISNAIKFTPKEGTINVKLAAMPTGAKLRISSNSGPISADETDKLFKRSTPLSTRPTHGESALGNGLFIAQAYAKKLSSKILFTQNGSTIEFSMLLPN